MANMADGLTLENPAPAIDRPLTVTSELTVNGSGVPGSLADDGNQRHAGVARLRGPVDQEGGGDRGQGRGGCDCLNPLAGDVEVNCVRCPAGGVGIEDRLAERAGAAVAGVAHQEAGEQRAVLHQLQAGAEPEDRPAKHGGRRGSAAVVGKPVGA